MSTPPKHQRATTFRRRRLALGVLALILIFAVASAIGYGLSSSSTSTTTTTKPATASNTTSKGPDGIVASWVVQENKKSGTTAWQIASTVTPNVIAGFANLNYADVGQKVTFYVTTPSPTFKVVAYRMGYYQGKGARQIWKSSTVPGVNQPACTLTTGINMVSCDNWTASFSVVITKAFVQGDYMFKFTGSGGEEGYVPLTVWDPTSSATYLVINRTMTEEGWNYWGGYDFYQGLGPCAPTVPKYPQCNRARVVSLDRPYNIGYGASDFFGNEYPLISFMEQHGLDLTYVTDITLDAQPSLQSNHKVLLSLGHDETWTSNARKGLEAAQAKGVNIFFTGAAAVLRHARMEASPLGPGRQVVNYRNSQEDPLNGVGNPLDVTGNSFLVPPTSWPEIALTGQEYSGYLNGPSNVPFVVVDGSAWVYQGTGLKAGDQLSGVVLSDIDHVDIAGGSPTNIQILGHSPIPLSMVFTSQGTWNGFTYSDMTYYSQPTSNSGVIDTGTTNWIYAMSSCPNGQTGCPMNQIKAITGNILRVFGNGPAGITNPSVSNWQTILPAGS